MAIRLQPADGTSGAEKFIEPASRVIANIVDLVSGGAPIASFVGSSLLELVGLFVDMKKSASGAKKLGTSAWDLVRASYACALVHFLSKVEIQRKPTGNELRQLVADLLRNADLYTADSLPSLETDHLQSPLKNPVFRAAAARLPHELAYFGLQCDARTVRSLFERSLFEGIADARNLAPDTFQLVESALSSRLAIVDDRRKALLRHEEYLIRLFTQEPIFGQETSGITLNDLYVRQRCLWDSLISDTGSTAHSIVDGDIPSSMFEGTAGRRKSRRRYQLNIGYLHSRIGEWLDERSGRDAVRVVAGGPGSGKSTFARALAIEAIDNGAYDVLYIPLQEIESAGSLDSRISNLFRGRTELGFDRVDSPLQWLGQGSVEGSSPEKPLLLICDGLDEIAPPDTAESINVTTDFIQNLSNWLNQRNSGGCYAKAIVLGRTIAAEEAFDKLAIDSYALLRVAGLLPLTNNREWKRHQDSGSLQDPEQLAPIDQRTVYWENWCRASGSTESHIKEALQGESDSAKALEDLTSEPLLLYLLLWTGFVGNRWKEAAENRNVVYEEIFKRIFKRDWGKDSLERTHRKNRLFGGHVGTSKIEEPEFFALQETLGLASWSSGGRIVTDEAFQHALAIYLDQDLRDDVLKDSSFSLKSVALQSYTKSSSDGNAGYEFVHKSLGEYLIARCLVSACYQALQELRERVSDSRCQGAANYFAKIGQLGALTVEIHQFFYDEVRTRFPIGEDANRLIDHSFPGLMNWVVRNGFPVHFSTEGSRSFYSLQVADARCLDVLWSFGQALLAASLPKKNREAGRLVIAWPTAQHFASLFGRLADRVHVGETKRLCSFDNLVLNEQGLTELTFGSVIFAAGTARPQDWLKLSAKYAKVSGGQFYSANMWTVDFEGAHVTESSFDGARMTNANFRKSVIDEVRFGHADLNGANFRHLV
ncbi:hypothetical protein EOA32_31530 [Mesorhizobium sp. M1A.F.Ca.ET.072.01.1.1]|uniref:pentapeptide repeat-containing protein n=1 Tax=Mesorhizobium sp. M1A.F.Ca.ET.072.01.1.1 TaxID=2496753 RepID=UPI000FD5E80E|nr:pentapeptide repeat-containing protein [Mesorhizobium sp. M1A.F.Ca.ET.072.01.1.1]RUW46466.1 hypothetical protein EOA32_31530 [Mesorhizobium sp. M1A.F.Ca.ET.072.01.1.1]TIU98688.1 MAG: hypothetical protein E5W04_23065 [Mesorhizobium sp.]